MSTLFGGKLLHSKGDIANIKKVDLQFSSPATLLPLPLLLSPDLQGPLKFKVVPFIIVLPNCK